MPNSCQMLALALALQQCIGAKTQSLVDLGDDLVEVSVVAPRSMYWLLLAFLWMLSLLCAAWCAYKLGRSRESCEHHFGYVSLQDDIEHTAGQSPADFWQEAEDAYAQRRLAPASTTTRDVMTQSQCWYNFKRMKQARFQVLPDRLTGAWTSRDW